MATKSFKHPLSDAEPDIILRSSDAVDFHVHRSIMTSRSLVFKDMFSIPLPTTSSNDKQDTLPRIELNEDATTLEMLLQFCYLRPNAAMGNLDSYQRLFEVAEKYNMQEVMNVIKLAIRLELRKLISSGANPFRAYVVACNFGLVEEGQAAAKATLLHPMVGPSCPELETMSGRAYHALMGYRSTCIAVFGTQFSSVRSDLSSLVGHNTKDSTCSGRTSIPKAYNTHSTWVIIHIDQVKAAFMNATAGSTIESPTILRDTLLRVQDCPLCRSDAYLATRITDFNERLARAVDEAIAKVSLPPIV